MGQEPRVARWHKATGQGEPAERKSFDPSSEGALRYVRLLRTWRFFSFRLHKSVIFFIKA
jgi:hypothetical protein